MVENERVLADGLRRSRAAERSAVDDTGSEYEAEVFLDNGDQVDVVLDAEFLVAGTESGQDG